MTRRGMNRPYTVEGWHRGMECFAFRRVQRPTTVRSTADTYIVDHDADRVIVIREGVGTVAEWNATGGWRYIREEALVEALTGETEHRGVPVAGYGQEA